jgi:hypothetical protein
MSKDRDSCNAQPHALKHYRPVDLPAELTTRSFCTEVAMPCAEFLVWPSLLRRD